MSKIKQHYEKYNADSFQKAIFTAMVNHGMECSVRQLADRTGLAQNTLNLKIRHRPYSLTAEDLRRIVQAIKPDIQAVLTLLGYSGKEIKHFKEAQL